MRIKNWLIAMFVGAVLAVAVPELNIFQKKEYNVGIPRHLGRYPPNIPYNYEDPPRYSQKVVDENVGEMLNVVLNSEPFDSVYEKDIVTIESEYLERVNREFGIRKNGVLAKIVHPDSLSSEQQSLLKRVHVSFDFDHRLGKLDWATAWISVKPNGTFLRMSLIKDEDGWANIAGSHMIEWQLQCSLACLIVLLYKT